MDSSGQQTTSIQKKPGGKQELEQAQVDVLPKKLRLHITLSNLRGSLSIIKNLADWPVVARNTFFLVSTLLIIGGLLYWKFYLNAMNTKSLTEGGYVYSFIFSRPAKFVQSSNGMRGYATDADHSAVIGSISGLPDLCGSRGDPYTLAFEVEVYGVVRPVCTTQDSNDEEIYMMSFQYHNHYHEFMVTYGYSQDAKAYPKLRTIFESITVSK